MTILTITYSAESPNTLIRSSRWNQNFTDISTFMNNNNIDSNDNIKAGGVSTAAIADLAVTDAKIAGITTAGKVNGSALTNLAGIPSGAGIVPVVNLGSGTPSASNYLRGDGSFATVITPYIKCTNTQTSGTGGGGTTSGSWLTAILNTKDNDTSSIATLAANKITLPAGTYQVKAIMPVYYGAGTNYGSIRLFNNTDSTVVINGSPIIAPSGLPAFTFLNGLFTITSSKDFFLQYQVSQSQATFGQGNPASFGSEVYATIEFSKVVV